MRWVGGDLKWSVNNDFTGYAGSVMGAWMLVVSPSSLGTAAEKEEHSDSLFNKAKFSRVRSLSETGFAVDFIRE